MAKQPQLTGPETVEVVMRQLRIELLTLVGSSQFADLAVDVAIENGAIVRWNFSPKKKFRLDKP